MYSFRAGLGEWWRIVNLSYEEVSTTPYLPIWTSGRGVAGVFFLLGGGLSLLRAFQQRKRKISKGNRSPIHDQF